MRNVWLIARREYLERVRTKAFLVSLVLFPLIMSAVFLVPAYFATHRNSVKHIAVVTADAGLGSALVRELHASGEGPRFQVDSYAPSPAVRAQLTDAVEKKSLNGFLWLEQIGGTLQATYYSNSAGDLELTSTIESALQHAQAREKLVARGMSTSEIHAIFLPVHVDTQKIQGGKGSSVLGTYISSIILMFMLYGSLISQGFAVSRSVVEEKTSRIFEVMLATVTPDEMLGGKLLGVGAVGLTQVGIWMSVAAVLTGPGMAGMHAAGQISMHLSPWNLVAFVVCFVLGFLFYSALSAMLGSMVNSDQELQQLSLFITLPLIVCVVFFQPVISDPSGTLAIVFSLLPPTAPLLMYLRIAVQTPPTWQIALSLGLMLGGLWLAVWLASRIYRVGVLMYGKRPTLPELVRWLRYS